MGKKSKKSKKARQICSALLWHKTTIKRLRQRFGPSKYQMLWITFGKGLLICHLLAFLVHRCMDSTQKLVETLVERRMRVTGESQAVATANVMAAFEKLRKDKE